MTIKNLFILTFGLLTTANAQEKVLVTTSRRGNKYYIYPSTIQKYNKYLKVWAEAHYATPRYNYSKKKYYTKTNAQELIDCYEIKSSFIAFTHYTKNGNVVNSDNWSEWEAERELESAPPNSVGWRIIKETCERYYQE